MFKVSPNENESLLLNEIEYTSFFENNKANNNPKFIITQIEPQNSNLGKKKNKYF